MELIDENAERNVLKILWEETTAFGAAHGLDLLERLALIPDDFSARSNVVGFRNFTETVKGGRVPLREALPRASEILDSDDLVSPALLETYAGIVRDLSMRRLVARVAQKLAKDAREPELSPPEIVAAAESAIRAIPSRADQWRPLAETMARVRTQIADGKKGSVPTGFSPIDMETGGLPPTLVVIAAMPGVGKSAFEGSILRNMATRGDTAAVFCMEDRSEWLGFRFLAHDSGVHQFILRNRALTASQWERVGDVWDGIVGFGGKILCDDRPSLTPAEVLFASKAAIRQHGARAVFLDNMTAMRFQRGPRMDLEIQDFLVAARALADETGVPFVVLSHVKRREDLDVGDMPRLTDCSETSAFEKLSRLAYGLCRKKKTETLTVGVLKNTNGRAHVSFELELRAASALLETERPGPAQIELREASA